MVNAFMLVCVERVATTGGDGGHAAMAVALTVVAPMAAAMGTLAPGGLAENVGRTVDNDRGRRHCVVCGWGGRWSR